MIGVVLLAAVPEMWVSAQAPGAPATQAASRAVTSQTVIKSQHVRLPFARNIQRVAVGDTEILSVDLINSREVLALGRETGRTTLIVWFTDGTLREYVFTVQRDLSVLAGALKRIDASIDVESAPDRDAIVLTGVVPTIAVSQAAEAVARNYLDAGDLRRGAARPFLAAQTQNATPAVPSNSAPGADNQAR